MNDKSKGTKRDVNDLIDRYINIYFVDERRESFIGLILRKINTYHGLIESRFCKAIISNPSDCKQMSVYD